MGSSDKESDKHSSRRRTRRHSVVINGLTKPLVLCLLCIVGIGALMYGSSRYMENIRTGVEPPSTAPTNEFYLKLVLWFNDTPVEHVISISPETMQMMREFAALTKAKEPEAIQAEGAGFSRTDLSKVFGKKDQVNCSRPKLLQPLLPLPPADYYDSSRPQGWIWNGPSNPWRDAKPDPKEIEGLPADLANLDAPQTDLQLWAPPVRESKVALRSAVAAEGGARILGIFPDPFAVSGGAVVTGWHYTVLFSGFDLYSDTVDVILGRVDSPSQCTKMASSHEGRVHFMADCLETDTWVELLVNGPNGMTAQWPVKFNVISNVTPGLPDFAPWLYIRDNAPVLGEPTIVYFGGFDERAEESWVVVRTQLFCRDVNYTGSPTGLAPIDVTAANDAAYAVVVPSSHLQLPGCTWFELLVSIIQMPLGSQMPPSTDASYLFAEMGYDVGVPLLAVH